MIWLTWPQEYTFLSQPNLTVDNMSEKVGHTKIYFKNKCFFPVKNARESKTNYLKASKCCIFPTKLFMDISIHHHIHHHLLFIRMRNACKLR